jgi:hypothetical protein
MTSKRARNHPRTGPSQLKRDMKRTAREEISLKSEQVRTRTWIWIPVVILALLVVFVLPPEFLRKIDLDEVLRFLKFLKWVAALVFILLWAIRKINTH